MHPAKGTRHVVHVSARLPKVNDFHPMGPVRQFHGRQRNVGNARQRLHPRHHQRR